MLAELLIELETRNPAANRLRGWRLELGRDLFELGLPVSSSVGSARTGKRFAVCDEVAARVFASRGLQRWARAPTRIGVAYRYVGASPEASVLLAAVGIPTT